MFCFYYALYFCFYPLIIFYILCSFVIRFLSIRLALVVFAHFLLTLLFFYFLSGFDLDKELVTLGRKLQGA